LTWPHSSTGWASIFAEAETVFTAIAAAISRFERLLIIVQDEQVATRAGNCLIEAGVTPGSYRLVHAIYDDTWTRDYGPLTIIEHGTPTLLDFCFNGWGGKFPAELDNALNLRLHAMGVWGNIPLCSIPLILEGGSIDVDGQGNLLTTESCLLAPTRNPQLDKSGWEQQLHAHLGIERVLWLRHGSIIGDDTDGHIDTLARFCSPELIAYQSCDDPTDENFIPLREMARELATLRQINGAPYRLMPLPWMRPQYADDGRRLSATYANFLIINHAVLVPQYNDPADLAALQTLQNCFPTRQIIGINCTPLILQNGSLHCVTMQFPVEVSI